MKRGMDVTNTKKAQAAMEFLMTYGWALLVVLVAIGALAFFGVLNPGQFLPDQCTMFSGLSCTTYFADASDDQIRLTFQNGLGYTMGTPAACTTCGIDVYIAGVGPLAANTANLATDCTVAGAWILGISDGGTVTCGYNAPPAGITAPTVGTRIKGTVTVIWQDNAPTPNTRSRTGTISLTAEA